MLSKRARLWLGLIAALSLLSLASSCSNKPADEETTDKGKAYKAKGDEGTISGNGSYTGAVPEATKIDTSAEAQCAWKRPNPMPVERIVMHRHTAIYFV